MKKRILIIILSLICFIGYAQKQQKIKGDKDVVSDKRKFDYFSKLDVSNKIKLTLKQSKITKLVIEADENLHEVIESEVENNTLVLSLNKKIVSSKKFNITLYVDNLEHIQLNDDSELETEDVMNIFDLEVVLNDKSEIEMQLETSFFKLDANEKSKGDFEIKTDSLHLVLKESSRTRMTVTAQKLTVDNYGDSTSELSGKTDSLLLNANDDATFKGAELIADVAEVIVLNKTTSYINAKESLAVSSKNKARIYVFNKPQIVIKNFEDTSSMLKRE